jgi:hypothetical protein
MSEEAQLADVAAALAARDCGRLVQLTRAASTSSVRGAGCDALAHVAEAYDGSPDHAAGLADTTRRVFEALVSVLGAEVANVDVLIAGLDALFSWCMVVPQAGVRAGEAGALDAVVAAMRVDTASARLQRCGCVALAGVLEGSPENLRLAAEANVVATVVAATQTHLSCATVKKRACSVLRLVAVRTELNGNEENRDAAVALGAIELVTAAIESADAEASDLACSALHNLISMLPERAARAQRCGAFEATVKAMRLHAQHLGMQTSGCTVLGRMGLDASACAAAERLGAHAAIIHALERFPAAHALQACGCSALAYLLPDVSLPDNDAKHAGAVACLVNALRAHLANAEVQLCACEALRRLVKVKHPLDSAEAFRLGGFAALAEVLKTHTADADVVEPCLAALRGICEGINLRKEKGPSELPPAADGCDAIRCVVAAMRAHPAVLHNQRHGAFILGLCLSLHVPDCAVAAAEAGAMYAAVAALRSFVADTKLSTNVCILLARLSEQWSSLREKGVHVPAAPTSDAIAATLAALRTHPGKVKVLEAAAYALARLCDVAAGSQTGLQDALAPLFAALNTHTGAVAVLMQRWVLEALSKIVVDVPAAVAAVQAGPAGIRAVIVLLMRSTPAQNFNVLKVACDVLVTVACCTEAKLSSDYALGPLVHVLCLHQSGQQIAMMACHAVLKILQNSHEHAAQAVRLGAVAAVRVAVAQHPIIEADTGVAALLALLATEARAHADEQALVQAQMQAETQAAAEARAQAQAKAQAEAQARAQAQAQAQAWAREEAARRADAVAAELIAEEEEAARAAAAPARKSRKKRGGGAAAAGGQRAEPAPSEPPAVSDGAPSLAAATAAALDELALNDASADAAADMPSAAAARRRRRAATKAARRQAGAGASGGEASAHGDEPASGGEDDVAEAEADAVASAEAGPAEALPPIDTAPSPAAAASLPPPPAPAMPVVMKECCVCLSDMPMAELLVVAPCGHRCLCDECWQNLQPPSARRCPICNTPAAMAMRVYEL